MLADKNTHLFHERSLKTSMAVEEALAKVAGELYTCDPKNHIEGKKTREISHAAILLLYYFQHLQERRICSSHNSSKGTSRTRWTSTMKERAGKTAPLTPTPKVTTVTRTCTASSKGDATGRSWGADLSIRTCGFVQLW